MATAAATAISSSPACFHRYPSIKSRKTRQMYPSNFTRPVALTKANAATTAISSYPACLHQYPLIKSRKTRQMYPSNFTRPLALTKPIRSSSPPPPPPPSPLFKSSNHSDGSAAWRSAGGIVGIIGDSFDCWASDLAIHALLQLVHRGQGGSAVVSSHQGTLHSASQLFQRDGCLIRLPPRPVLDLLPGSSAIAHVTHPNNVDISINSNLALVLTGKLRPDSYSSAYGGGDPGYILNLIASKGPAPLIARVVEVCESLQGAYSFILLSAEENKLIAVREPHGFHPLIMGRRRSLLRRPSTRGKVPPEEHTIVFASETSALGNADYEREVNPGEAIVVYGNIDGMSTRGKIPPEEHTIVFASEASALGNADYEREVNPGEVIVVDGNDGMSTSTLFLMPKKEMMRPCISELFSIAMPLSLLYGRVLASDARNGLGEMLACQSPVQDADVVISVIDGSWDAAVGFARVSGISYELGLKASILADKSLKLETIPEVVKGKSVVVVEDSMDTWDLMLETVSMIKDAGAREVHIRIASPPVLGSCDYGVSITPNKLDSNEMVDHHIEALRTEIGCNSLSFLSLDCVRELLKNDMPTFCDSCFLHEKPNVAL